MLTCGAIVVLILFYKGLSDEEISLEEIIAQLPEHIYWKSRDCNYVGSNTNNWRDFGFKSYKDYKKSNDYTSLTKEEADQVKRVDENIIREGEAKILEEMATKADGTKALYLSHKVPLRNKYGKIIGLLGVSVDITHAKRSLEDRLKLLEDVIAAMPGNVYWMDKDHFYLGCNDHQAKLIGLSSRKEIVGKRNVDIPGFLIPEILDPINQEVMTKKKTIDVEEAAILPNGNHAIFLSNKRPLFNSIGEVVGMVGVSLDITDRKAKEKLELENQLAQEKMNTMKILSGSIAHEIRTPLARVSCIAGVMDFILPKARKVLEDIAVKDDTSKFTFEDLKDLFEVPNNLRKVVADADTFISMLLQKLKSDEGKFNKSEQLSILACISEAVDQYPDKGEIIIDINKTVDFQFLGERQAFIHVIWNLMKNAIFYIHEAGKGKIEIWTETGSDWNVLHFKDTGTGMKSDQLKHIFEGFYSETRHGTGIGLPYCKLVMKHFDGDIECEAKEGQYTHFVMKFPAVNI